jgi:galactose-1-phosphate uridylyltransferase
MSGIKPLRETEGVRHVSFFHNHRPESGGSQEHPHSQIIASPIIPTEVSAEFEYALKRQEQPPRRCVYCEIIEAERAIRDRKPRENRVLFETEHFLAVQAYAAIYPFETWIIPKRHSSSFATIRTQADPEHTQTELSDLAGLVDIVVQRLYACLDDPPYNLILKTDPVAHADEMEKYSSYHWHIRIEPRGLTVPAGYESSTGIFTSPTPPEETAAFLQQWGILAGNDDHQDGTLSWYLRLSKLAAHKTWPREMKALLENLNSLKRYLRDFDSVKLNIKDLKSLEENLEGLSKAAEQNWPSEKEGLLQSLKFLMQYLKYFDSAKQNLKDLESLKQNLEGFWKLAAKDKSPRKLEPVLEDLKFLKQILGDFNSVRQNLGSFSEAPAGDESLSKMEPVIKERGSLKQILEGQIPLTQNLVDLLKLTGSTQWPLALRKALTSLKQHRTQLEPPEHNGKELGDLTRRIRNASESLREPVPDGAGKPAPDGAGKPASDGAGKPAPDDEGEPAPDEPFSSSADAFEKRFDQVTTKTIEAISRLGPYHLDKPEKVESAELGLRTILDAVQRAPVRLRNILAILDRSAVDLSGFRGAKAWLDKTVEKRPELLLSQSQLPPEEKQRLQITAPAGGYQGPHYRRCPATGQWVLIPSKARRKEVADLKKAQVKKVGSRWQPKNSVSECGFCKKRYREDNKLIARVKGTEYQLEEQWSNFDRGWDCYVIENKVPLFSRMSGKGGGPLRGGTGPFESIEGKGISNLIVIGCGSKDDQDESHYGYCADAGHLTAAFAAVGCRMKHIMAESKRDSRGIRHIAVFSNHRAEAGAHLSHLNWQLIASPIVPMGIARELDHGRLYFDEYFGRCCFCDMIQAESAHTRDQAGRSEADGDDVLGNRIIGERKDFVVVAPYASRSPFEVWIMPTKHESSIADMSGDEEGTKELAGILADVLEKLNTELGDPGYSMLIQNAPIAPEGYEDLYRYYHWRIIIETKDLVIPAGYEHLTGIWSNSVTPETAAKTLRLAPSSEDSH